MIGLIVVSVTGDDAVVADGFIVEAEDCAAQTAWTSQW